MGCHYLGAVPGIYSPPPPPIPIEPVGTYARSSSPEPSYLGKRISPYLGHWLPFSNYKETPLRVFSRNLLETTAQKYTLSREKVNLHAAPSCIQVGGGGGGLYVAITGPTWLLRSLLGTNAVVTPLLKAASYEPRIAILGIWGDTWLTRGKYGIYVAVRGSYGVYVTPSTT